MHRALAPARWRARSRADRRRVSSDSTARPRLQAQRGDPRRLLQAGRGLGARQRVGRRDGPRAAKALRRPLLALLRPAGAAGSSSRRPRATSRASGSPSPRSSAGCGWRACSRDTPAQRAGIEEGDLIIAVDGRSIAGVPAEVSTARIKGPPGTPVELRVVSGSRRRSPQRQARARLGASSRSRRGEIRRAGASKVAYVRFATFSDGRPRRARDDDRAPLPPRRRGPGARPAGQRRRAAERGRAVGRACSSPRASWSSPPTAARWATATTRPSATRCRSTRPSS